MLCIARSNLHLLRVAGYLNTTQDGGLLRERSFIMAWGVGKLEGGTELFGALGWGEPICSRQVYGRELIFFDH